MPKRLWFVLIGLSLLGSGCSLVTDATCLTVFTVRQSTQDFGESIRNRKWAGSAWEEAKRADPDKTYSSDYARGFKDGFAHYVYRGGNGEPPPLPPSQYRSLRSQTPQGYKAIEDWFAGFRHGAAAARQNGYRKWVTGPSALRDPDPEPDPEPPPDPGVSQTVAVQPGETKPTPASVISKAKTQRTSASQEVARPPAPLPPKLQSQRISAPTAPAPLRTQTQRASTPTAPAVSTPLPRIIAAEASSADATNRDAKRLPVIINGEEAVGRVK